MRLTIYCLVVLCALSCATEVKPPTQYRPQNSQPSSSNLNIVSADTTMLDIYKTTLGKAVSDAQEHLKIYTGDSDFKEFSNRCLRDLCFAWCAFRVDTPQVTQNIFAGKPTNTQIVIIPDRIYEEQFGTSRDLFSFRPAFATVGGKTMKYICVREGILNEALSDEELSYGILHEIRHLYQFFVLKNDFYSTTINTSTILNRKREVDAYSVTSQIYFALHPALKNKTVDCTQLGYENHRLIDEGLTKYEAEKVLQFNCIGEWVTRVLKL